MSVNRLEFSPPLLACDLHLQLHGIRIKELGNRILPGLPSQIPIPCRSVFPVAGIPSRKLLVDNANDSIAINQDIEGVQVSMCKDGWWP